MLDRPAGRRDQEGAPRLRQVKKTMIEDGFQYIMKMKVSNSEVEILVILFPAPLSRNIKIPENTTCMKGS